jgi:hypothetical protein
MSRIRNVLTEAISYDRQREMDLDLNTFVPLYAHIVVGCGGIGYWSAIFLAMMGANHLVLVDGDRVEASNLNRIPAPVRHKGELKVHTLKAQLRLLRPGVRITCLPANITEETLEVLNSIRGHTSGVIWDCTDDARIQQKISRFCSTTGLQYVKLGYEGWKIGMYRNMQTMWVPDDYQPGYVTSRANVLSSAIVAALGVMYGGRANPDDVELDLKTLVDRVVPVPQPSTEGGQR